MSTPKNRPVKKAAEVVKPKRGGWKGPLENAKPFKKGFDPRRCVAGIPKGYKPVSKTLKRALAMPWKIDPNTGEQLTVSDYMAAQLVKGGKARRGNLAYIQEIIRATEGTKVTIEGGEELGALASMSIEDLAKARAGLLRQREADDGDPEGQ